MKDGMKTFLKNKFPEQKPEETAIFIILFLSRVESTNLKNILNRKIQVSKNCIIKSLKILKGRTHTEVSRKQ